MQGEVAYAAAKAGLCGFVRALAVDAGASGEMNHLIAPINQHLHIHVYRHDCRQV